MSYDVVEELEIEVDVCSVPVVSATLEEVDEYFAFFVFALLWSGEPTCLFLVLGGLDSEDDEEEVKTAAAT